MRLPKIIAGSPVILLILLPCLYCLYFQVKQQAIRMEMEERLESEQVQTVVVPVNEFRWYEEGREILVDGMMFDVKSMREENGNYIITGLFDENETKLHIALGKLQESNTGGPDAVLISKLLLNQWTSPAETNLFELFSSEKLREGIAHPNSQLYKIFLSIQTPPPRC
jgi:hypothetical protein